MKVFLLFVALIFSSFSCDIFDVTDIDGIHYVDSSNNFIITAKNIGPDNIKKLCGESTIYCQDDIVLKTEYTFYDIDVGETVTHSFYLGLNTYLYSVNHQTVYVH